MNELIVEVPIKRYLKKYLYAVEYVEYDTPIDPRKGGPISILVNILFTGKLDMNFQQPGNAKYNDTVPLLLTFEKSDRFNVNINNRRLQFFHSFLHRSFHNYLVQRVMWNWEQDNGTNQSDTIKQVIEELDIIDDVDFDALKKAVYRKKKTANLPLFS